MNFFSIAASFEITSAGMLGLGAACLLAWTLGNGPVAAAAPTAEEGRAVFNGKGMCSTCHGIDAHRDQLPAHLTPKVRENILRLDPKPADLRNASGLKLSTDKQRFDAIRHGHLRSSMQALSKHTLSDNDILAVLAYLASIRGTEVPPAPVPGPDPSLRGEVNSGRQIYHEIGGCAICHGTEGRLDQRPPISADLAQKLDALPIPPADLRNPATLKSRNDEDVFKSIKRGHPGTAMFPKSLLRDEDIRDLVAYLATLRGENR